MARMKQINDYETSTRICPCGASIEWSGVDERLGAWMNEHEPHASDPLASSTSPDGMRAYAAAAESERDATSLDNGQAEGASKEQRLPENEIRVLALNAARSILIRMINAETWPTDARYALKEAAQRIDALALEHRTDPSTTISTEKK